MGCRKKIISFTACIFLLMIASAAFAGIEDLERGDELFREGKFQESIRSYQRSLEESPGEYGVLWRLSRSYSWASNEAVGKKEQKELLRKAVYYGRLATATDDEGFDGYLWLAVSAGKLSKYVGSEEKVKLSEEIKDSALKAIEYNPIHFKAYLVLGVWHRKVATSSWIEKSLAKALFGGLPDASLEESEELLKKAVELEPDFIENHYELALTYKALNKRDLAGEELIRAENCPVSGKRQEEIKEKVESLLKKIR